MKSLEKYLVVLSFFCFAPLINAQIISPELLEHTNSKIQTIDSLIRVKEFNVANEKIESLKTYSRYFTDSRNVLNIDLKKSRIYLGQGDGEKAITLLLDNLSIINESPELIDLKYKYCIFLGDIFQRNKDSRKALDYYKESLDAASFQKDTVNIITAYWKLGRSHYSIKNNDSAEVFFKKGIDYPINELNKEIIAKTYNDLGILTFDNDSLGQAQFYWEKALLLKESIGDPIEIAVAQVNLSNIFFKKKDYYLAKSNYENTLELVSDIKTSKAVQVKETSLYNIAYANEMMGDFKQAYKFLELASNLTDSLSEVRRSQNISEIEAKYNVEKQTAETEREKRKRAQAQALFYGTALAFLALLSLGYIFYRNYRLKQQAKLDHIENESQTKIINATIDAKEKERKAIAETLHDSVSALLSSANLHLQATKAQLKQKSPQEITKAQTIVNEASVKIRDLSHELISSVLLKFGLAFAVHDMCQKYSNSELTLHSDDDGIKRYHQDFEIKIHNIIEELINNILKHSKANNATIMLAHKENDMLSVRISDDGVGFNPRQVRGKDGLGLSHIKARIKVMKGVFNIISSKDNGTNIFILVPIQFKEKSVSA